MFGFTKKILPQRSYRHRHWNHHWNHLTPNVCVPNNVVDKWKATAFFHEFSPKVLVLNFDHFTRKPCKRLI